MATPVGSDFAPKGEYLQASSSSSSSMSSLNSSSSSTSSFTSGESSCTIHSTATTSQPTNLTIRELEEITDNFSEERLLGQGAYGKVYKGMLKNGEEIAVKLLYNNMQAIDDEKFQHEFTNLMMLNHKNTVRLVSYCYETRYQHVDFKGKIVFGETTYKALCFEYMHMGSLQSHLSDETLGLDWQTRYNIIKGTCEGLKYLHEGFEEPIYHLDLKPDNILLDKNMVPKLADFGLSRLFSEEEQTRVTQSYLGTIGYMPPEYLVGQVVSKKLDIFSLGVVITKIIAGPRGHTRSAEMPFQEFLDQVNENWRNRLEAKCTSEMLEANCEQVSICTEIGLRCMDKDRHKRPSIVDIIHMLDVTETMIEKRTTLRRLLSNTTLGDNISSKVPASIFSEAFTRSFCRQTVDNALKTLDSREDYKLLKAEESPRRFKDISDTLLESIVTMYDHETEKYDPKVRDKECQSMVEKLRKVKTCLKDFGICRALCFNIQRNMTSADKKRNKSMVVKVFIEDSRELIRKMLKNASEQFKREYAKNLKSMEESGSELKYDDLMVDSCVEEFMNSCEDLKVFDLEYLHMKRGELQKRLHLYTVNKILTIQEIRGRKEVEQARQRSNETVEELVKKLEEMTQEKQNAEADAEMTKENLEEMTKEKQTKDELEYTRQMLAKEPKHTEKLLSEKREHIGKTSTSGILQFMMEGEWS